MSSTAFIHQPSSFQCGYEPAKYYGQNNNHSHFSYPNRVSYNGVSSRTRSNQLSSPHRPHNYQIDLQRLPKENALRACGLKRRKFKFPSAVGTLQTHEVDPYFGHKAEADICAAFIVRTFGCPTQPEAAYVPILPSLSRYIAQVVVLSNLPYSVFSATIILLQRLSSKVKEDKAFVSHRLFLSTFIISAQEYRPRKDVRNFGYWSTIGRFPAADLIKTSKQIKSRLRTCTVYPSSDQFIEKAKENTLEQELMLDAGGCLDLTSVLKESDALSRTSTSASDSSTSSQNSLTRWIEKCLGKKAKGAW